MILAAVWMDVEEGNRVVDLNRTKDRVRADSDVEPNTRRNSRPRVALPQARVRQI
jgi:hypothetical protein